jgi:hypothetical protein
LTPPRLAIPNSAARPLLATTNFDLLFYSDRLVAAKGLTLGSGTRTAARDMRSGGVSWAEMGARDASRIEQVSALTDHEVLSLDKDNRVLRFTDVVRARLSSRVGVVKLTLDIDDGQTFTWRWLRMFGSPKTVAPSLEDLLGQRFTGP